MNVVIYARYSSAKQTEQSIEGQLHACYKYAEHCKMNVIGEYIDRAISGTTDRRLGFQRMITDASQKQFQYVLVWKFDRFSRSRHDSAFYKQKLLQYGVRVISVMENGNEGDDSTASEIFLEAFAEHFSTDLSENIIRGQHENIKKGRFCGGTVPYGYKIENGKLVIDERTAPHIRYVFEQYASGVPMRHIIDELTRRGVRSMRGYPLSCSTFSRALTNTAYIGQYKYKGEIVPGLCERMIDDNIFERANAFVAMRKYAPSIGLSENVRYILYGKVFCGHCGAAMVGENGRGCNKKTYYYYTCSERKKHHSCSKSLERKEVLEQYVVEQIFQNILTSSYIARISKLIVDQYNINSSNDKITALEKQVLLFESDLNKLVDSLLDAPKITHKRIYEKMEALEAQKNNAGKEIAKLRTEQNIHITEAEVIAWLTHFRDNPYSDLDFSRIMIDTFIDSIYVYDDHISVFYNIKPKASQVPNSEKNDPRSDI